MNAKTLRGKRTLARSMHGKKPSAIKFNSKEKRLLAIFAVITALVTIWYWSLGGRNIFVFPAIICIGLGVQKVWDTRKFWQQ